MEYIPSKKPMEESWPPPLIDTCYGLPNISNDDFSNITKASLADESLDNFHMLRHGDTRPSWNFLNPQTAGVPYTEQCPKNEGKWCKHDFIYSGLLNTDKASVLCEYRNRHALWTVLQALFFIKKKKEKKSKSVTNHFTVK